MLVRGTSARFYSLEFLHYTARRTGHSVRGPDGSRVTVSPLPVLWEQLASTWVGLGFPHFPLKMWKNSHITTAVRPPLASPWLFDSGSAAHAHHPTRTRLYALW